MIDKIVQAATEGKDSKIAETRRSVVDKDGEDFIMYQIKLKQYLTNVAKYDDDLEKFFVIIM